MVAFEQLKFQQGQGSKGAHVLPADCFIDAKTCQGGQVGHLGEVDRADRCGIQPRLPEAQALEAGRQQAIELQLSRLEVMPSGGKTPVMQVLDTEHDAAN